LILESKAVPVVHALRVIPANSCVRTTAWDHAEKRTEVVLGSDKSRGYSLEMICADFLAGAALQTGGSEQNLGCSASGGYSSAASEQPASTENRRHE
jgi:hypothetical protein